MTSEVTICNLALAHLGQAPITNLLEPGTRVEELCALMYPLARDSILNEHVWSFTTKRVQLTPTNRDITWREGHEFTKPPGTISVIRLYTDSSFRAVAQPDTWYVEGDYVYSTNAAAYAMLTVREADTNRFSPTFIQALAARLAVDMCISITENLRLLEALTSLYTAKLREAVAADGMQARRERIIAERLINVRAF